jgi:hypothetical protein
MKAEYTKPNGWDKLTKAQVLEAMENGAILRKTYCVYSYYDLTFPDGTRHFNIRKGAAEGISARTTKNVILLESNSKGIAYKMITQ